MNASLLHQALRTQSLLEALAKVQDKNGVAGTDGQSLHNFAENAAVEIKVLQQEVLSGRYQPRPLLRLWLPRPGKTPRAIGVPTVRDRVLHSAIAQELTPRFEAEFEDCSFAYRKGRSVRQAIAHIERYWREGFVWLVEADISAYFDNIPHDKLLQRVQSLVNEPKLIALLRTVLQTPVLDAGRLLPNTVGVSQGSPLSPMLANLYLDHLDESLLGENHRLVRYADDFVVLAKTKTRAQQALELTQSVLTDLSLRLHPDKTRVVSFEQGFDFLGWRFVRSVVVPIKKPSTGKQKTPKDTFNGKEVTPMPTKNTDPEASDLPDALEAALTEALQASPLWQPSANAAPDAIHDAANPSANHTESTKLESSRPEGESPNATIALTPEPHLPSMQRTLYLIDPSARLACDNQRLIVHKKKTVQSGGDDGNPDREEEEVLSLPTYTVDLVMLFGPIQVTAAALQLCMTAGIDVAHLSQMGRFRGITLGVGGGDGHERRQPSTAMLQAQFATQDNMAFKTAMSRHFVHSKLHNSILILKRYSRRRNNQQDMTLSMSDQIQRLKTGVNPEALLGMEGSAAAAYFAAWREWLPAPWGFDKRARQPPPDPVNALLSFGYSVLYHCVAGLLQARGLDVRLGIMHTASGTHMALASDLMEGFRAPVVDAVVLNLCLNRLSTDDFVTTPESCTIKPEATRIFIHALEAKLNTPIKHPETGDLVDIRRLIDSQVLQLQRAIRAQDASLFTPLLFK